MKKINWIFISYGFISRYHTKNIHVLRYIVLSFSNVMPLIYKKLVTFVCLSSNKVNIWVKTLPVSSSSYISYYHWDKDADFAKVNFCRI